MSKSSSCCRLCSARAGRSCSGADSHGYSGSSLLSARIFLSPSFARVSPPLKLSQRRRICVADPSGLPRLVLRSTPEKLIPRRRCSRAIDAESVSCSVGDFIMGDDEVAVGAVATHVSSDLAPSAAAAAAAVGRNPDKADASTAAAVLDEKLRRRCCESLASVDAASTAAAAAAVTGWSQRRWPCFPCVATASFGRVAVAHDAEGDVDCGRRTALILLALKLRRRDANTIGTCRRFGLLLSSMLHSTAIDPLGVAGSKRRRVLMASHPAFTSTFEPGEGANECHSVEGKGTRGGDAMF